MIPSSFYKNSICCQHQWFHFILMCILKPSMLRCTCGIQSSLCCPWLLILYTCFYAILCKHLENVWKIPFHFVLSPKGHWHYRISPHSSNSAAESRSHHSFLSRLHLYSKTLGYLFLSYFFFLPMGEHYVETQKRTEHHLLVWCWVCK